MSAVVKWVLSVDARNKMMRRCQVRHEVFCETCFDILRFSSTQKDNATTVNMLSLEPHASACQGQSAHSQERFPVILSCQIDESLLKSSLRCGVNTSLALSLRAWISDASNISSSSMSATGKPPFQIPTRDQSISEEHSWQNCLTNLVEP